MSIILFESIYLPLLLLTAGIAFYRWRILSKADRWICTLLFITLLQESLSGYLGLMKKANFATFHFYTAIELFLIALYFDRSIGFRRPYIVGICIGIAGIIVSAINTYFFQPMEKFNSYFLLFEQCVILSLCLLSFYRLLIRDNIVPSKMAHFWLTICFLFYSSLTYADNGLYGAMVGHNNVLSKILDWTRQIANILFYFGIALVFIRYKKLIPSGE
jgi:hypothetical protein